MIELIYLENGLYIKNLLKKAYANYLDENHDWEITHEYERFVEQVFTDVINWYSWDMQENDNSLALLGFDPELAEDLLDSISALDMKIFEDWSIKFTVEYLEFNNSIIVRAAKTTNEIVLPNPNDYTQSYNAMRKRQLTSIARLLNELRLIKN